MRPEGEEGAGREKDGQGHGNDAIAPRVIPRKESAPNGRVEGEAHERPQDEPLAGNPRFEQNREGEKREDRRGDRQPERNGMDGLDCQASTHQPGDRDRERAPGAEDSAKQWYEGRREEQEEGEAPRSPEARPLAEAVHDREQHSDDLEDERDRQRNEKHRRPTIRDVDLAIVGAGKVGTALAVLLSRAGHRVIGASGRDPSRDRVRRFLPGVPFVPPAEATADSDVVIFGVPDDRIAGVCADLAARGAFRRGHTVVHLSGSVSLEALAAAVAGGARALSIHPLQTFPDVETAIERLPGSPVAVTAGDRKTVALGERLAADAGGRPFRLADANKPLYHAAAVFCSNYLVAVEGLADRLFRQAGIDDPVSVFAPLAESTLQNVLAMGPAEALTGPVARGDAGTIRQNLEALESHAPDAVPVYVALAGAALDLAEEAGRIGKPERTRVEEVLGRWR